MTSLGETYREAEAVQGHGLRLSRLSLPGAPRSLKDFAFVLPYLPFLIGFGIAPMLSALWLAVTNANGGWEGLGNFGRTFTEADLFWPAAENVLVYTAIWLAILAVFVVGLALLLHGRANRVSATYRFLFYLPGALSGAASVLVWLFMLDPSVSPFGFLLKGLFGIHVFIQSIEPQNLPIIFAIIAFWTGAGGWIVVMYGALNTVPHEIEEAARLDGAGPILIALRLKLPMIQKWIAYMLILSFATGTQVFTEPTLVGIASLNGIDPNWSTNELAYQLAFRYADFNGAAAVSVDLLLVGLMAAVLIVWRTKLFSTDT